MGMKKKNTLRNDLGFISGINMTFYYRRWIIFSKSNLINLVLISSFLLHRQERDLYSRKDQFGVELRERAKWDLREAMVGTETFLPKHVVIATWKNVSFAGGIPQARRIVRLNSNIFMPQL